MRVLLLAAAVALSAVLPAHARDGRPGWYASLAGAYVLPRDSGLSTTVGGLKLGTTLELKDGFGVAAAVGYGWSHGVDIELELGWRNVLWDKLRGATVRGTLNGAAVDARASGSLPVEGRVSTLSLMANAVYSIRKWRLRPYIGIGFGAARHSATFDAQSYTVGQTRFDFPKVTEDAWAFAYQAMAGVSYPVSGKVALRAGYRYFETTEADFSGVKASLGTHNFEIGALYRF